MSLATEATAEIRAVLADAGVRGWVHARMVGDGGAELGVRPDEPVTMASVFKLPVLVALVRAVDAGDLDPRATVTVDPSSRTHGPTGLSVLSDPVTMSLRDLATSMTTVSDNAAADVLLDVLGPARVRTAMAELGLAHTRVERADATFAALAAELGVRDPTAAAARLADPDDPPPPSAYDPVLGSATTARDMTTLLAAVWRDTAASPTGCAFVRRLLGLQVSRARIASGFPFDEVRCSGKTGTLGALRNEVGVVEFPGEAPVAVAVFTLAARPERVLPRVDAAIGEVARLAVTALRLGD
ncbi:serine hydrolase [Actinomycetospora corticicola]|uniref:Beta-lactamase class A n=1 Tax=Actinomycetospora corticicola TaxID=663602 RepID=A0A7Y9E1U3_9PSEU|nr:serine hydrolase [Actinomycetospora corticicola]NYD39362.1 beta-lactamase class A [Actinomycetospora corticicola]